MRRVSFTRSPSFGRVVQRARRLPGFAVPYLAHPVETVRLVRSDDVRRSDYLSKGILFRRDRLAWRVLAVAAPVVVVVLVVVPVLRPVAAVLVAVVSLAVVRYRWRNSSRSLRRRGLPPGRLAMPLYTAMVEPGFYRRCWERYGPVFTTTMFDPTVAVAGLERASRLLRRHGDDLMVVAYRHSEGVEGGAVRNQDGDRHRRTRTVLVRAFSTASISASRPWVEAAVRRHLAAWAADPAHDTPAGRPVRDRVGDLVLDVWITLFYGIDPITDPVGHARLVTLIGRYDLRADVPRDLADRAEQLALVAEWARTPDRLAPSALRTLAERMPDALDDPVITTNLTHIIDTTRQDVRGLLTWLVYHLAHEPAWCERIARADGDEPARWAVAETLRLDQSEAVIRQTRCEVDVEGHRVPAGWMVRALVRESHRDPAMFPDPERFDPTRFADGAPPADRYAPFGLDHHACVGEAVTQLVATVTASELCRGFTVAATHDGPPMLSEYYFWAPSLTFRARLTPRADRDRPGERAIDA